MFVNVLHTEKLKKNSATLTLKCVALFTDTVSSLLICHCTQADTDGYLHLRHRKHFVKC